jgi:glycosyltransferase involved in cell wall biosynthesis
MGRYWSCALAQCVKELTRAQHFDIVHLEPMQMWPYMSRAESGAPVVVEQSDTVETMQHSAQEWGGLRKLAGTVEARRLRAITIKYARLAKRRVAPTGNMQQSLQAATGVPFVLVRDGVDVASLDLPREPGREPRVVFVGSMAWRLNSEAAEYLVKEIMPRVWAIRPGVKCQLVGSNPPASIRALASERVEVTGTVPDVRPYLAQANVVTAPMLWSAGTNIKSLEALASGCPVVATSVAMRGLLFNHREHYFKADTPHEFANAIVHLIDHPEEAERMGAASRRLAASHYDWSVSAAALEQVYLEAAQT